ncbi:serine/threonine-protein kinase [Roseateles chitinivorans]|uniref:serine/threonine-protein kinase n=1 Tax=Roseateles chitinivorans TaxID=2917965 RepID=UPI003D678654
MSASGFLKRLLGRGASDDQGLGAPDTQPTTLPMPRAAGVALDDYEISEEVGRGAMAVVHRAVDRRSGRTVAIKRLALQREFAPEDLIDVRDRFMREASAARHLDHPDILRVLDAGECAGETWIAMEYVVGQDLSHHTRPGQLLPLREVLLLGARLGRALQYAHGHGVVHRDIKPANVMLERESGSVKIMDFGIARVADGSRTRTGLVLGTPSYMSPEQLAGLQVDGRSDLYSLGAMLFQLLTGHLPHQTESMATLMHQIMNQPAPDVRRLRPELPESLAMVVALSLEKRPELRYQRGDTMAQDLESVLSQIPVELANSTGATPPPPAGQAFEQTLRLQSQGAVHNPLPPADPASKT